MDLVVAYGIVHCEMPGSSDGMETGQVCSDSDDNTRNYFITVANQDAKGGCLGLREVRSGEG